VFPVTVECSSPEAVKEGETESSSHLTRQIDESASTGENKNVATAMWACGAAGSALPWHGRGHRFDPDQVHQLIPPKIRCLPDQVFHRPASTWCQFIRACLRADAFSLRRFMARRRARTKLRVNCVDGTLNLPWDDLNIDVGRCGQPIMTQYSLDIAFGGIWTTALDPPTLKPFWICGTTSG
jgi:hypothetical protein